MGQRNDYDTENELLLNKNEIYGKTIAARKTEINTFNNKIKYEELKYHFKSENRTSISL